MGKSNGEKESLNTIAKGVVDGTGEFLGRICLPAAEEFGLLLRDKVKAWRNNNFLKITEKTKNLTDQIEQRQNTEPSIHPRLLIKAYEEGSWADDLLLQKMWSGLLASSCFDNASDRNIIYLDVLGKMSSIEAKLFNHICQSTDLRVSWSEDTVSGLTLFAEPNSLKSVIGASQFEDVDQTLTHLVRLGLISLEGSGSRTTESFDTASDIEPAFSHTDVAWMNIIEITVTNFGIRLYFKSRGLNGCPSDYVKDMARNTNKDEDFDEYGWGDLDDWYYLEYREHL